MATRMLKLSAAAIAIAAFASGSAINSLLPDREAILNETFPVHGLVNEAVHIRTGEVSVHDVGVAHAVSRFGTTAHTSAVFLTFTVTYLPNGLETTVAPIEVEGGNGHVFGGLQAYGGVLSCGGSQAGLPISCPLAVEISPEALPGARIRIHNYSSVSGDDVAVIDLGIDDETAAQLAASDTTFEIGAPTYGGALP
ncbi:MAG: hypothetical protein Q4P05_08295 [Actinomycetaceae bacterium]|nr:hypothetical protein [Actinomycetaceae bacterium]